MRSEGLRSMSRMVSRRELQTIEVATALGAVVALVQVEGADSAVSYASAAGTGALIALAVACALVLAWRGRRPLPAARPRREAIPERVRHEVWRRDRGTCVECGSRSRLEFDHIIPVSRGGSNTPRNLELRCEPCNRRKGARV
jgi:hypothetical protein